MKTRTQKFYPRAGITRRCIIGLAGALALAVTLGITVDAGAVPIDRYMTVNPIQVCDNAGLNCAPINTYSTQTAKVYAQAGIATALLPTTQINNSALLSSASVANVDIAGAGQHSNPNTINVWFLDDMPTTPGFVLYGEAWVGANGVAINATDVNAFNGGVGRIDTVAHEIGHNLGLRHADFGAGGADNLMTRGSVRSVPGGIGDITPDGADLDMLTAAQVTEIRSSSLLNVVPEVVVDASGSTAFDTDDFFIVDFQDGPAGVSLLSLTVDLSPVNAFFDTVSTGTVGLFPGGDGSPFAVDPLFLSGIGAGDISVAGGSASLDGQQTMTINLAPGALTVGDSFRFGLDIDLISNVDGFGATPAELIGTLFDFTFSDGFGTRAEVGSDGLANSTLPMDILQFIGDPTGGTIIPKGRIIDTADPLSVPEPGTVALFALGLIIVATRRVPGNRRG